MTRSGGIGRLSSPPGSSGSGPGIEVTYVLRRRDVFGMYLGSWGARISAAPGAAVVLLAIVALPGHTLPMTEKLEGLAFGLFLMLAPPLMLPLVLAAQYGIMRLVGRQIRLVIDERGVSGWPVAPWQDRSWTRLRRVHRFARVTTLPFQEFGTRAGWVPVPDRALSVEQRERFQDILSRNGVA